MVGIHCIIVGLPAGGCVCQVIKAELLSLTAIVIAAIVLKPSAIIVLLLAGVICEQSPCQAACDAAR